MHHPYKLCATCNEYRARRRAALAPHLANRVIATGRTVADIVDTYMDAVHERHLAGLSLDTDGAES